MGGCQGSKNKIHDDVSFNMNEKTRLENFTSKTNIRDVYSFSGVLGKGGFGTVKLASLKSGVSDKKVAVKIIEKNRLKSKMYILLRELEILRSLDHPNIIKFYEVYQDEMFFYICMEYCAGGELLDRITKSRTFKEQDAAVIMDKLFSAINHMHSRGIVHRDIKPENILFLNKNADSEIKIVDFGLSVKCDGHDLSTMVGTPLYVSPNVLKGRYDESCDNWSAGVILYVLLVGYPPFFGKNKAEVFRLIEKAQFSMEGQEWNQVSSEAKDLVRKLLVIDSKKRLSTANALKHKWIVKHKKISEWSYQNLHSVGSFNEQIDPKILNLMKNFRIKSKFRSEVMKIMVNLLNEKEIESLKNTFKQLDVDQTGQIKITQLSEVMENAGLKQTKEQLEKIVRNISPHQEGGKELSIGYSEFIAATLDQVVYLKQEKLWSLFKYFDNSDSNYITLEDLKEIFLRNGRNIPQEELKTMVQEVDPNNDGKISFDEFKLLMSGEEVDFKS